MTSERRQQQAEYTRQLLEAVYEPEHRENQRIQQLRRERRQRRQNARDCKKHKTVS